MVQQEKISLVVFKKFISAHYIYIFSQTVTSICYHIFILANNWSHKFGSY